MIRFDPNTPNPFMGKMPQKQISGRMPGMGGYGGGMPNQQLTLGGGAPNQQLTPGPMMQDPAALSLGGNLGGGPQQVGRLRLRPGNQWQPGRMGGMPFGGNWNIPQDWQGGKIVQPQAPGLGPGRELPMNPFRMY